MLMQGLPGLPSHNAYHYIIWVVVKIMAPLKGTLNIRCRIIIKTPKRDPNFDNHPYNLAPLSARTRARIPQGTNHIPKKISRGSPHITLNPKPQALNPKLKPV